MIYIQLFLSFVQIGLFSIGGGYAAMPLIQNQVVYAHNWLTLSEFTDLITIAEMTPGPIAINSATFVGTRISGIPGSLVATFGCILPSCIIVSALAFLYYKFRNMSVIQKVLSSLRPAVVALIASAGLTMLILVLWSGNGFSTRISDLNVIGLFLFLISMVLLRKFKLNPIKVMMLSGAMGFILNII